MESQIGRRVTDAVDGILTGKRYLIHDRDPLFTTEFHDLLKSIGVTAVMLPSQSPNLNAYAERFVRSIKESCLDRLVLFRESSLRSAAREFVAHYHTERNHQGLQNRLMHPNLEDCEVSGSIKRRQRIGGMLNYYYRGSPDLSVLQFSGHSASSERLACSVGDSPAGVRVRAP
jgi:hypothetical protein